MNMYPAVTKLLAVINVVGKPHRFMQPAIVVLLGVFSALLAIAGILEFIEGFLSMLGSLLFPFSFILVIDWYHGKYYSDAVSLFYQRVYIWTDYFLWSAPWAISMLISGLVLAQLGFLMAPAIIHLIPWQICSAAITGGIYYMGIRFMEQRGQRRKMA